ncbi:late endosomal/lysosomal mp1 interacting protein [Anaeramoeba ignava]|uniref:Late endosomal/lysosomal mp1 interacting protein n=1 Tax=Anaeramoeba ignava TaxID=1746090 RepID=A0A9Q0LPQ6_ANAIG|nr:late endosomal/lysosomal mp1 interacting protein [Anaeramoeba ignava]
MLHNVLIISRAGMLLFNKDFLTQLEKPGLLASLISTIFNFSLDSTGMAVSYIELTKLAITVVNDDATHIYCVLFHDMEDGAEFGKIVANEILDRFKKEYNMDFNNTILVKSFHGFHSKIPDAIRNTVRPVLVKLQRTPGVKNALLVEDTVVTYAARQIDQLGVVANIRALLISSSEMMSLKADSPFYVSIDNNENLIHISKIEKALLVVVSKKSENNEICAEAIHEAVEMLKKVFSILSNLDSNRSFRD